VRAIENGVLQRAGLDQAFLAFEFVDLGRA
jgi:hypothetical protein